MSGIKITDCSVHVCRQKDDDSPLLGFARIVFNGVFVVSSIRIVRSRTSGGAFISFPRDYNKQEGKGFSLCYPIEKGFHDEISERILKEYYHQVQARATGTPPPATAGKE